MTEETADKFYAKNRKQRLKTRLSLQKEKVESAEKEEAVEATHRVKFLREFFHFLFSIFLYCFIKRTNFLNVILKKKTFYL